MRAATAGLSQELERAALHAVRRAWDDLNGTLFKWQLVAPGFELSDSRGRRTSIASAMRSMSCS